MVDPGVVRRAYAYNKFEWHLIVMGTWTVRKFFLRLSLYISSMSKLFL